MWDIRFSARVSHDRRRKRLMFIVRKGAEHMAINDLLSDGNYIIVLDTNVLLNVYRYSPEFSEFVLECLRKISDGRVCR